MVKYGPVRIGDGIFICPLRAVNFSAGDANSNLDSPARWLNETLFTGYHHFKATARILSDGAAPNQVPARLHNLR